eukprot:57792-Prymnesium_polylepis.1
MRCSCSASSNISPSVSSLRHASRPFGTVRLAYSLATSGAASSSAMPDAMRSMRAAAAVSGRSPSRDVDLPPPDPAPAAGIYLAI